MTTTLKTKRTKDQYLDSTMATVRGTAIHKIYTCLNKQYFAMHTNVNRRITTYFHASFHINSWSDFTLICGWSKMNKL